MTYYFGKKFELTKKSLNRFTSKELVMIFYSKNLPLKKVLVNYLVNEKK